ncbi:MAG: hypothetical protein KC486_34650 [Myxococcales bacterium]|nr:hypothetical protein [Myxococcales bacterium]
MKRPSADQPERRRLLLGAAGFLATALLGTGCFGGRRRARRRGRRRGRRRERRRQERKNEASVETTPPSV